MTTNTKKKNLGRLFLFLTALFWGVSFVLMKNVLGNVPPMYILMFRFCGAALLLLPACAPKLKRIDKSYILGGVLMGLAIMLGYIFQTFGLRQTTPGKNAFLTSVYCVIVPFLYWAYRKKRPDKFNAASAAICIVGIGFISLDSDLRIGAGDALTIVCGFFLAIHMVITARFVEGRDPVLLAMIQFATGGLLSLLGAVFFESAPSALTSADIWSLVFLTCVCTAGCLLMQVMGQKYTPPSQAAVILTFESVFGALTSVILSHDVMTVRLSLGFALMFFAVFISETKLEFLKRSKSSVAVR